jgi:hypothetical protein
MIVYFAAAIRGDRSFAKTVKELIWFLKENGATVLTEHLTKNDPVDRMPAEEIETRDIKWLDEATHVIAEISGGSTGVGREIEYARNKELFGKVPAKVLCLYQYDREFYASPMIRGMTSDRYPNVVVRPHQDLKEAKSAILEFIKTA